MTHLIITFGQQVLPILVRLHVVIVAEILNVFSAVRYFQSAFVLFLSFFLCILNALRIGFSLSLSLPWVCVYSVPLVPRSIPKFKTNSNKKNRKRIKY